MEFRRVCALVALWASICTAAGAVENPALPEPVLELARTKTGAVLLAYGREARDQRRYSDAITCFQAAMQADAGRRAFRDGLQSLLLKLDNGPGGWEDFYSAYFDVSAGLPTRGNGYSPLSNGLFGAIVDSWTNDPASGMQSARLSFQFFGVKKPLKPDEKPRNVTVRERDDLIARLLKDVVAAMGQEFPGNPVRITKRGGYFQLEGFLSTDYPVVIGEAMYELGRTYQLQGDYPRALGYYQDLLERPVLVSSQNREIDIRYHIVDIHQVLDTAKVAGTLKKLVEMDAQFDLSTVGDRQGAGIGGRQMVRAMSLTLQKNGLDSSRVGKSGAMDLYRFDDNRFRRAHVMVGVQAYRAKNLENARAHLGYAAIQGLGAIVLEVRRTDPLFEYPGLRALLQKTAEEPVLLEFAQGTGIYENLYYLALVLQEEKIPVAQPIFQALAATETAGTFQVLARNRLQRR